MAWERASRTQVSFQDSRCSTFWVRIRVQSRALVRRNWTEEYGFRITDALPPASGTRYTWQSGVDERGVPDMAGDTLMPRHLIIIIKRHINPVARPARPSLPHRLSVPASAQARR